MSRRGPAAVAAAVAVVTWANPAAAHGVGSRGDLPLDFWQFAWGATAALVVSFALVGLTWTKGRLTRAAVGRAVPIVLDRAVAVAGLVARAVALALFVLVITAALFGAAGQDTNPAPYLLYITMWVGAQLVSAVLGDVWRAISPFETIAATIDRVAPTRAVAPAPAWTPWASVVGLGGFLWLELCFHDGADPRIVGVALVGYTIALTIGTWRWGRDWIRRAEGFGVLFGLLARLGIFFRDADGRLRVRPPVAGLAGLSFDGATLAIVLGVLGSTTFDGLTGTQLWRDVVGSRTGWESTIVNTAGLATTVAVVAGAYLLAATASGRVSSRTTDAALVFGPSLVPIVLGYSVAHYFSLFVLDGQAVIGLLSDPFDTGADWFGTGDRTVDYLLVSTTAIAWVQVLAIVLGHIAGVVAAHDRALDDERPEIAVRSQYPLLGVMVGYTVLGLALMLNA